MQDRIDEEKPEDIRRREIPPEDKLSPELTKWRRRFLRLGRAAMLIGVGYIIYICVQVFWNPSALPECICWPYLALAVFLSGLVSDFIIRHKIRVHKSRKEDRSEIEALIQDANNIQPRLTDPERPDNLAEKRKQIENEVHRLTEKVGAEGWTEFQVLRLDQLLIDFLPLEDLKARARSSLDELQEYADGDAFSYDVRLYYDWEEKIKSEIDSLDRLNENSENSKEKIDDKADALRANLRSLREHVADYQKNWAEGSTIVSSIRICGSVAVVVFTLMGILPVIFSVQNSTLPGDLGLGVLNWGFLGVAGAIASALIGLRNAEEVEVGYTFGKQELWRAVLGAPLGLLAGILAFSALAGGLIKSGSAVPDLANPTWPDIYLSIVWAVVTGMGFESVFQRMRRAVDS